MTKRSEQRTTRPKNALMVKICALDDAPAVLEALNAKAKDGYEWKQDKATLRARAKAEQGKAHLCCFAKSGKKDPKT